MTQTQETRETIKILILEDDKEEINWFYYARESFSTYHLDITEYNEISYELYKKILTETFDCLIIDLKLQSRNEQNWNDLIRVVRNKLNIPIIVNTWYINYLDEEFETDNNYSWLYQIFDSSEYTFEE